MKSVSVGLLVTTAMAQGGFGGFQPPQCNSVQTSYPRPGQVFTVGSFEGIRWNVNPNLNQWQRQQSISVKLVSPTGNNMDIGSTFIGAGVIQGGDLNMINPSFAMCPMQGNQNGCTYTIIYEMNGSANGTGGNDNMGGGNDNMGGGNDNMGGGNDGMGNDSNPGWGNQWGNNNQGGWGSSQGGFNSWGSKREDTPVSLAKRDVQCPGGQVTICNPQTQNCSGAPNNNNNNNNNNGGFGNGGQGGQQGGWWGGNSK